MSDVIVTLTYTEAEAREVMRALHYFDINVSASYEDHDRMNLIRSAISRAIPVPKPDEPTGLGAVVEDAAGRKWILVYDHTMWQAHDDRNIWRNWSDIDAVRVLSAGWSA